MEDMHQDTRNNKFELSSRQMIWASNIVRDSQSVCQTLCDNETSRLKSELDEDAIVPSEIQSLIVHCLSIPHIANKCLDISEKTSLQVIHRLLEYTVEMILPNFESNRPLYLDISNSIQLLKSLIILSVDSN